MSRVRNRCVFYRFRVLGCFEVHEARGLIEARVRRVEKIETAVEAAFQQHFVNAMALPHGVDRFPELEKIVALPKAVVSNAATTGGRRRKRRTRPEAAK